MRTRWLTGAGLGLALLAHGADFQPAPQSFRQELARPVTEAGGRPLARVQCLDAGPDGVLRALAHGRWWAYQDGHFVEERDLAQANEGEFVFAGGGPRIFRVPIAWRDVFQVVRFGPTNYLATPGDPFIVRDGQSESVGWPSRYRVNQIAVSHEGELWVASSAGLFRRQEHGWEPIGVLDSAGRAWATRDVLGVTFDSEKRVWFATRAGVGCRSKEGWKMYEGKDGLPWNDFTGVFPDPAGGVWFGTRLGAIRFDGRDWSYRQGPRWLPDDEVAQIYANADGQAWLATGRGVGLIERQPYTLARKAEWYEEEIDRYIRRTPFGFVAEAPLAKPADKTTAYPQDSDNDGLWTAMYGAGECFAYAATHSEKAKTRARRAFEALRFLQKVTQGGAHAPPLGYIARTIRPADWPDPNVGRLEQDREAKQGDSLWKIYEPRWPKSADGQWFWKSDTSSDELDGHYFFYPLYYDFCAESEDEKSRVREVVRDVTDHLLQHQFLLIDHDGRPTRWGIYGPQFLNRDPMWWAERGLKSLSILSYLAVAAHVTGDPKYETASRELVAQHGYAHNAMFPKVQQGPGSGNQSDDEMAFMCYYTLLRYSTNQMLTAMMRYSFLRYWANEAPEMNPFFNFAYAAHNLDATATSPWGTFSISPWPGWHEDAMATLYSFPLDRLDWPHRNSHRLDIVRLARLGARDLDSPDRHPRGHRLQGKVLPVENRHFNHWNTDPWQLDYSGSGHELAAGTVFLLPYYLGLYHGFIQRP